ncbi:MAG TPA: 50S ribosomal protein L3, partial [Candidatus Norongarragalinales archaeon]|nr:50S ribosomal protein L3 [Candidatus Norongarragalinales archaeon]
NPLKGQQVTRPVTILETPPLFVYAAVGYENTPYGLKAFAQVPVLVAPKELSRFITPAKKAASSLEKLKEADTIRLLVATQPWKTNVKRTPEVLEMGLGGNKEEAFLFAQSWLGKEISINDVFEQGQYVDAIAVTTGKGWQGVVRRFGVALNPHKATKSRRHGGTLGGERQAKVMFSIPRPGQMGFHRRTDRNKRLLIIGSDAKTLKADFRHYGPVQSSFLVIDGSLPGPVKRMVRLRRPLISQKHQKPDVLELFS